jgi:hypothetical protein
MDHPGNAPLEDSLGLRFLVRRDASRAQIACEPMARRAAWRAGSIGQKLTDEALRQEKPLTTKGPGRRSQTLSSERCCPRHRQARAPRVRSLQSKGIRSRVTLASMGDAVMATIRTELIAHEHAYEQPRETAP